MGVLLVVVALFLVMFVVVVSPVMVERGGSGFGGRFFDFLPLIVEIMLSLVMVTLDFTSY
jgi:hypothetical protein